MQVLKRRDGFTLVEVLVAVGIISVLAVAVASMFGTTAAAHRVSQSRSRGINQRLLFEQRISRDLWNAVPYDSYPFHGDRTRLVMVSSLERPVTGAGLVRTIHFVAYVLDEDPPGRLLRIATAPPEGGADTLVLAGSVSALEFAYGLAEEGRQLEWQQTWSPGDPPVFPAAVRIRCAFFSSETDKCTQVVDWTIYLRLMNDEDDEDTSQK